MGTTGGGKFKHYDGNRGKSKGSGGKPGGKQGGGKKNECEKAIGDILLEEVANCQYFRSHKNLPPIGSSVNMRKILEGSRLAIETDSGEVLGYLPIQYNYLRRCMEQDYKYSGNVISASATPLPSVRIDLGPV